MNENNSLQLSSERPDRDMNNRRIAFKMLQITTTCLHFKKEEKLRNDNNRSKELISSY